MARKRKGYEEFFGSEKDVRISDIYVLRKEILKDSIVFY